MESEISIHSKKHIWNEPLRMKLTFLEFLAWEHELANGYLIAEREVSFKSFPCNHFQVMPKISKFNFLSQRLKYVLDCNFANWISAGLLSGFSISAGSIIFEYCSEISAFCCAARKKRSLFFVVLPFRVQLMCSPSLFLFLSDLRPSNIHIHVSADRQRANGVEARRSYKWFNGRPSAPHRV